MSISISNQALININTFASININSAFISSAVTVGLLVSLDAGNTASYPGSGSVWTDTISSKAFTLFNTPTYNAASGGYITFVPGSSQYAQATSLTSSLAKWTMETWHYYTGTNSSGQPTIITEVFPGSTSKINFSLGTNSGTGTLQSGFFDGAWRTTTGVSLTTNTWNHIVGTYDGAINKLYVNNVLVQTASYSGAPATSQGGIRLMRRWDSAQYWGGRLAIVNIYTGSFTAADVSQNYNTNRGRFGL